MIEIVDLNKDTNPRHLERKNKKSTYESINPLYESRGMVLNVFKSGIFYITI